MKTQKKSALINRVKARRVGVWIGGVDVTADRMCVTIYGDGSGRALPLLVQRLRTSLGRVARAQQATPPMGPPAAASHGGNSTPVLAPVAGVEKSERVGERGCAK